MDWKAVKINTTEKSLKYFISCDTKDGKTTYTFAFLRNVSVLSEMHIAPYYTDGKLIFNVQIREDDQYIAEEPADQYELAYLTVTVDDATAVSYSFTVNGVKSEAVETVDENPDYRVYGDLHVELVKYMVWTVTPRPRVI